MVYNPGDDQVTCFDDARKYCASVGSYYKLFSGPAGFLTFVIAIEHFILICKVFFSKIFSDDGDKFDHQSRLNSILRSNHEATQAIRLQERIDRGDESAEDDMNPYSKIAKEGVERMQGQDEGLGKDDIYDMKKNYEEE